MKQIGHMTEEDHKKLLSLDIETDRKYPILTVDSVTATAVVYGLHKHIRESEVPMNRDFDAQVRAKTILDSATGPANVLQTIPNPLAASAADVRALRAARRLRKASRPKARKKRAKLRTASASRRRNVRR